MCLEGLYLNLAIPLPLNSLFILKIQLLSSEFVKKSYESFLSKDSKVDFG